MVDSSAFLKSILDSVREQIAVIDTQGNILFVNQSWIAFGQDNQHKPEFDWTTVNYIKVCDESAAMGDNFGSKAAKGIRKVIASEEMMFYFEYPCHSPTQKRWFMMSVTPFILQGNAYFVISHQNITKRKIAEEAITNLSNIDGLTHISNRRYFNKFLKDEWKRCSRLELPVTLAILDLDYFKLINDTYGHQVGDECLKKIAMLLKKYAKRPSDICARYGGEEFALVFGNTDNKTSMKIINKLMSAIAQLAIPNEHSPIKPILTISVGLVTMHPTPQGNEREIIKYADDLLYCAKTNGRNQIVHNE